MANITLVDADGRGSLLAWPDAHAQPLIPYVSTDGFAAIANMSMIGVDDGEFRIRTVDADMDVIVDVMGVYRATDTAVAAGRVIPVDPYRAYDTRTTNAGDGPLGERELRTISVADPALPADATGVVVTFTVANTTVENTWFSVLPGDWDLNDDGCPNPVGEMLPCTSTLNIQAGDEPDLGPQSRANQVPVLVSLDQFKGLQVYALHGGDVVVDVTAYVTGPGSPTSEEGLYIQMLRPAPIWTATFTADDATASHQVAGASGIPQDAIGVTGIIALRADERAHATVHPADQTTPETSTMNAREGEYLHGHYTTALSPSGELSVHSPFEANATLSLTGYYTGSIPEPAEPDEYEPAVLAYDAQQRLIETQTATGATTGHAYWPDGTRAAQHHPNGSTTVYLGASEVTVGAGGAVETATRTYSHAGVLVAARTDTGGLEWLFGNHQGSITTTVTDGAAETRWYTPYGNRRGPQPQNPPTTRGFVGQHEDTTGLTYLNNRYLDPTLGVFISLDPLVSTTFEPYVYGAANPVTFSDPSGLLVIADTAGAVVSTSLRRFAEGWQDYCFAECGTSDYLFHGFKQWHGHSTEPGLLVQFGAGLWDGFVSPVTGAAEFTSSVIDDPSGTARALVDPDTYWNALKDCVSGVREGVACAVELGIGAAVVKAHRYSPRAADNLRNVRAPTRGLNLPFRDAGLRSQVDDVVRHFDEFGTPPPGVAQGGLKGHPIGTSGNKSDALPSKPLGYYTESDVWVSGSGVKRGTERLIFGQGGEVYYSPTHYDDFVRIR